MVDGCFPFAGGGPSLSVDRASLECVTEDSMEDSTPSGLWFTFHLQILFHDLYDFIKGGHVYDHVF